MKKIFKRSKSNFLNLSIKQQNQSKTVKFYVNEEKGTVVCRLYDRFYDTYHVGKAQCLSDDKFDEKRGRAIAFNRARQNELLYNLKSICDERDYIDEQYRILTTRLDKREDLNQIYLAGVNEELAELVK
jgi:hypothetical protein